MTNKMSNNKATKVVAPATAEDKAAAVRKALEELAAKYGGAAVKAVAAEVKAAADAEAKAKLDAELLEKVNAELAIKAEVMPIVQKHKASIEKYGGVLTLRYVPSDGELVVIALGAVLAPKARAGGTGGVRGQGVANSGLSAQEIIDKYGTAEVKADIERAIAAGQRKDAVLHAKATSLAKANKLGSFAS